MCVQYKQHNKIYTIHTSESVLQQPQYQFVMSTFFFCITRQTISRETRAVQAEFPSSIYLPVVKVYTQTLQTPSSKIFYSL